MEPLTLHQFLLGIGMLCIGLASDSFWWRFAFGLVTLLVAFQIHVSGVDSFLKAPTQLPLAQTVQRRV